MGRSAFHNWGISKDHTGVQSINDVFHNVNKVENVFVYTLILNLIDNVEYVVYALYSSILTTGEDRRSLSHTNFLF